MGLISFKRNKLKRIEEMKPENISNSDVKEEVKEPEIETENEEVEVEEKATRKKRK